MGVLDLGGLTLIWKRKQEMLMRGVPPQVKGDERLVPSAGGLLIRRAQPRDEGLYYCQTTENGFRRTAAKVRLRVLADAAAQALADKRRSPWALVGALHPKALLPALGGGPALSLQQYCKEQRLPQGPAPPAARLAKLKPFLDRGKSRNRRNHRPTEG